ncbi:PREDICTED: uncharacterized protein LOC108974654 [Bactrocera latifrons]|uniref:uncharacterized protein LOC108974654 n=1 Tax=Bactrocera latifrons TaxID=174628 RepID=UPI0008DE0F9F|nr:PREDICTED: uncharacterized protein LOC108974654 [Bactrocera latifrons]
MYFVLFHLFIIFNINQTFCSDPLDMFKEMGRLTQTCLDLTCTNLNDLKIANEPESHLRKDVNCLRMCLFLHAKESSNPDLKANFVFYKRNEKAIQRNECIGF